MRKGIRTTKNKISKISTSY